MNPGTLDTKIQIQRKASGARGRFGADGGEWALWKTRMAKRVQKSGSESTDSGREIGRSVVVFRIRHTAGLALTDRVLASALVYDIVDILPIGRRSLQDLSCVLHANTRPES